VLAGEVFSKGIVGTGFSVFYKMDDMLVLGLRNILKINNLSVLSLGLIFILFF
jgi:hypothetical protein